MGKKQGIISIFLFTMILCSSYLVILNSQAVAPGSNTIMCSGYVKDNTTNAPIVGAKVKLMELETGIYQEVTTGTSGFYKVSITVPSYMSFRLTASKSGYVTKSTTFYSPGTYTYNFYLVSNNYYTITCQGYVRDFNTESGVSYASVTLRETSTGA
ncbi:MAG: carboxypeptidase-like regulatory domain-containing protein, partial [Candidatus Thorarchaeota archaeon]